MDSLGSAGLLSVVSDRKAGTFNGICGFTPVTS